MVTTIMLFVIGLGLLILGAESLVRGASRLAALMGVSPLVIGLTIVAFGTSSPELVVSLQSSIIGQSDIALGNIVGSNIFNVLFILGISAMIAPLTVSQQLVRLDVPIMILVSILTLIFSYSGKISSIEGIIMLLGGVSYTGFLIFQGRKEETEFVQQEYIREYGTHDQKKIGGSSAINIVLIAGGLLLLVTGSRWFLNGAVSLARSFGVSEFVIGLTLVAAGTSLPEVATSIVAAIRGERDIAVGNVVGSNIFNILAVLGLSAVFAPGGVNVSSSALHFDIPVMIAVAVACLPIFFTGNVIARWEGFLFFGYYLAYVAYLIIGSKHHDILPIFSFVMLVFAIPLTILTLIIVTIRSILTNRKGAAI
jgi:cation:H+ antiporter